MILPLNQVECGWYLNEDHELNVCIGNHRRNLILLQVLAVHQHTSANLDDDHLNVQFEAGTPVEAVA